MKISEWLDKKEAEGIDVSQITLPDSLSYEEASDGTIFLRRLMKINNDGILSIADHPFSTVERFGRWYFCRRRNKATGIHSSGMEWQLFTKEKDKIVVYLNLKKEEAER
jgi:hypothetical protein